MKVRACFAFLSASQRPSPSQELQNHLVHNNEKKKKYVTSCVEKAAAKALYEIKYLTQYEVVDTTLINTETLQLSR